MKAIELKAKDTAALQQELNSLLKEQFNLRMKAATGQLGRSHQLKDVRRNIARVYTVMNQKKRGE